VLGRELWAAAEIAREVRFVLANRAPLSPRSSVWPKGLREARLDVLTDVVINS